MSHDLSTDLIRLPAWCRDKRRSEINSHGEKNLIDIKSKPPKSSRKLTIIYVEIADLKPDPRNPRLHSPTQTRAIARSVQQFGFLVPVLIDTSNQIIAGHGRIQAAKLLGWSAVPAIQVEHLSEPERRAFALADNQLTLNAEWDDRLLAEELRELSLLNLDFSLELTGFAMGEIDLRIESLDEPPRKDDPADRLPEQQNLPAVSKLGDLWLLDDHRVFCGSALERASYAALMNDCKAAAVISDVPYNLRISAKVSLGAVKRREFPMASGEMSTVEFTQFLSSCCSLFAQHSLAGSLHYLFIDWRHLTEMLAAGLNVYSEFKNLCVWAKDAAGMGSFYRSQHELICVFKHGRERHRNNIQLGQFGRNRSNLWSYPCARTFGRKSEEEGNLAALHPTVKPVALIADAIMDCTSRHDTLLDGFLGSGTTIVAAQRTGRHCYGIELDPLFVDVIVRRWQDFTRSAARHAHSGKTFNEIEAELRRKDGEKRQ
jgi:DNA modification methylase